MNHIYCSIYNERTGAVVTVSEYAGGGGKRAVGGRQPGRPAWALNSLAVAAALVLSPVSHASPAGGAVVAGSATISNAAKNTTINQTSQNAVLNWQSFNIGTGESVRFVQPNGQSVALNRVLGTDPSSILGSLSANGKVFLVNPNGILFGTGAQVTVGALVASTRDISVSDFLAGHYKFSGDGHGSVVNQGSIQAAGGYVALLGASVSNQGVISAKLGTVALAAGNAITLDVAGDGLLNVSVDAGAVDALVQNGGLIQADGGQVLLTAQSASGLLLAAVNNSGTIEAQTIENRNGSIKLLGDMQSGTVNAGGTLDASAPNGGDGGFIETSAAHVKIDPASIVTAAAAHGAAGNWLIDPVDFTVATSGGDMTGAQLSTNLGSSNVTIQSGSGASGANGDINVNDKVSWSANQLTLSASHDININATLTGSGTASLALKYGQGAPAAGNSAAVNVNAPVNLPTGNNLSETLGSDGAPVNYAVINDMTGLQAINSNLAGNYALGSDLDATGVSGFAPLGPITAYNDTAHEFSGSFDGLGHTISNLTISKPSNNFIGMFSGTASAATIKNVGLLNANVTGVYDVAALVGFNYGTISNSYATGVTTGADFVGGLVGYNSVGTITNTYANVTVTTGPNYDTSGGGLIAYNYFGTINNSYAAGSVTAANSGGLVGFFNGGTINSGYSIAAVHLNTYGHSPGGLTGSQANGAVANNSYWDITTSGQTGSSSGVGLTTAQLEAALPTGFSSAFWGNSGNQTTPYLLHNPGPVLISTDTSNTYYKIVLSLDQLQRMNSNLAGAYALGNDIDASATGVWNFVPVGNSTTAFTGTFDGLRHNIAGLSVNLNADNAGLFGVNGVAGTIRNVILTGANIYNGTHSNAGSLVGYNQGAVANAYSTSLSVNGGRNAGGLVGTNVGTIDTSATGTGNVGATFFSGGLVGYNNNAGAIRNTYSGVNAGSYLEVGGLVGGMDAGTVENSYSTGTPYGSTATFGTGGFIGYVGGGTVTNSFWNSSNYSVGVRTGSSTGFTGLSSAAMKTQGSFTPAGAGAGQWDFTNVWYMYEGSTTPLLRAFLTPLTVTANNVAGTYSGQAYSGTPGVSYSTTPNMSNVFGSVAFAGGGTNVGTYSLTPSGLYSNQLGYMISFAAGTLTINPYSVSLTGSRAYDGTNVVAASYLTLGALANGETLTLAGTGTVVDKNAGTGKTVSLGTLALGDGTGMASNYIFTGGTQTADITPKALTATATAQDKIYDGNTTASATLGGLAGLVGSEAVGVSGTATFNSKDVANASLVTVNSVTLSDGTNGGLASNYALASGQTAVAHIRPKALTATATAQDKVYNGNTTASATLGGLTGLIGSETVGVSGTGNFNSKDVVYANLVTVNSITLSDGTNGGLASNYALASGETAAAHITPRALTATANAQDKVYDGNTTASATLGGFTGLAGSETLGVIGTATFNSKDVANANLVTVNSITLSNGTNGGLASNYALAGGETAVAHITPRA
ncbi:MAG: hypothetical protein JWM63_1857, partial [Gammaproteobacteria bacterium]|nr:hypothetical protein [Gammaproteobacteria bacterium]